MGTAALDGAEIHRDFEGIGQPIEPHVELALQLPGRLLGEIGVGTFVIDIDADNASGHAPSLGRNAGPCNAGRGFRQPLGRKFHHHQRGDAYVT